MGEPQKGEILEQRSKYLYSIRVFSFFNIIFLLKWNKWEIFKRRYEKDQNQLLQPATLLKKRLCHVCFLVNFAKSSGLPVVGSERQRIVKSTTLQRNVLHKLIDHYVRNDSTNRTSKIRCMLESVYLPCTWDTNKVNGKTYT